jgi:hypothetical protein
MYWMNWLEQACHSLLAAPQLLAEVKCCQTSSKVATSEDMATLLLDTIIAVSWQAFETQTHCNYVCVCTGR